ncbi:tetratricopeptide repeat protein, partial [Moorena sp. SIO4A5]|uniref:CHAT domain-containing protein n=1 Tax=Moorena sp. SIO4A5 TaxID=2607838 RepID=UPI0013C9C804
NNIGSIYKNQGKYSQALDYYQQALAINQEFGDHGRHNVATNLNNIGSVYNVWGEYDKALDYYQQALAIFKEIGERSQEANTLNNIGSVYSSQGEYDQALEYHQQSLAISQDIGEPSQEAGSFNNIGFIYSARGEYDQAKEYYQKALAIFKDIGEPSWEGTILNNIAQVHYNQGEYAQALENYQKALEIAQDLGERSQEATILSNIGLVYSSRGDNAKALNYHQQSLEIRQDIGDKEGLAISLNNIGTVYNDQGEFSQALDYYQQALTIQQEIGVRSPEATTLGNIGTVYGYWGKYPKALEYDQKALAIRQEIADQAGIGTTYNSMGVNYLDLGDYPQALDYFNQANAIFKKIGHKEGIAGTLSNIGLVYQKQKQYPKSLQFYQQSLAISQQIGNRLQKANTLTTIGRVYEKLGEYTKALDYHQQALEINQTIGFKAGISSTLYHMGIVYTNLEKYPQALAAYQQALALSRTLGTRLREGQILAGMGKLYDTQNQSELAITFFKQSVNVREGIRKDLKVLPVEQQQSFTDTVAEDYRHLADLLTQQNRNLEALRVLDLLKVQELQDYLSNVRGDDNTVDGITELTEEQEIIKGTQPIIDQAIALGQELSELETIVRDKRTQSQQQRIIQLRKNQAQLTKDFQNFLKSPEVEARLAKLRETTEAENLDLKKYAKRLQEQLQQLEQDAVILYPLVLEDRLELVLVTPYAPPIRRTVKVKQKDLERAIQNFRRLLANPARNARTPAEQLYEWLIKPIEADLAKANAKTIIYAPDGKLRYIPLGALYDGEQWLIERLRVNQITALSLTSLDNQPTPQLDVFAAAVTKAHTIPIGDKRHNFDPLQYAQPEVERLAETFPNTKTLIDKEFHGDTIYQMNDYSVVHLATHALFDKTKQDSFILFGDGSHVTLSQVEEKWDLSNVDLVVLSACQTGLGGELGDGKEILGFGYLMQNAGADAAIASLWSVNDEGTQALMNKFYQVLKQGNVTKAEALRQAQIALITKVEYGLEHPFYWAPFILIGNGL